MISERCGWRLGAQIPRGGGQALASLQLVACSATASYRLQEEIGRLMGDDEAPSLQVVTTSEASQKKPKKRATGERGLGGVGVPQSIRHAWVPCAAEEEKPRVVAAVLRALCPACALLFLADDAPLRLVVKQLRGEGVDAAMLHEAMGMQKGADAPSAEGYAALRSSLEVPRPQEREPATSEAEAGAPADGAGSSGGCRLLVSTRASARGLDLANVDCVLLDSLPAAADQYLHLAGRTGRQGREGTVISLLTPAEEGRVGSITRALGISLKRDAALVEAVGSDE